MNAIKDIKKALEDSKVDGVLISSVPSIIYLTNYSNFAIEEREAYLVITQNSSYIIADPRNSEAVKKSVKDYKLLVRSLKNTLGDIFQSLVDKYQIKTLGIEEHDLTVAEHKFISQFFKKTKHFDIHSLRSVKTSQEIELIRKACQIGDEAFNFVLEKIKAGLFEKDIAFELEYFIKRKGATISFDSIVAFSNSSSVPHHQTGMTKLDKKEGQFVLLDFGVKYQNYCSDMTRTVFFGKPNEEQIRMYKTVLGAQDEAVNYIKNELQNKRDVKASEADKVANKFILDHGYPSIPHSLGHGIGLEVHEKPTLSINSKDILKEGMVFSIEPGIYIEDFGGVRIEDLFSIQNGKLIKLTKSSNNLIQL